VGDLLAYHISEGNVAINDKRGGQVQVLLPLTPTQMVKAMLTVRALIGKAFLLFNEWGMSGAAS
jgi:hypothetical protein